MILLQVTIQTYSVRRTPAIRYASPDQLPNGSPQVLHQSARDKLEEYRHELDDLSARLGATSFGRAEELDPRDFQPLKYVFRSSKTYRRRCCYPETEKMEPLTSKSS